jgi:ABC-type Fe3+ transport system permease subunit
MRNLADLGWVLWIAFSLLASVLWYAFLDHRLRRNDARKAGKPLHGWEDDPRYRALSFRWWLLIFLSMTVLGGCAYYGFLRFMLLRPVAEIDQQPGQAAGAVVLVLVVVGIARRVLSSEALTVLLERTITRVEVRQRQGSSEIMPRGPRMTKSAYEDLGDLKDE